MTCKDGTTSKAGQGACSGHGGVDKGATKSHETEKQSTKAESKSASTTTSESAGAAATAASVICKDGTTSKGGKGACSGHGGVDKSASASKAEGKTHSESTSSTGGSGAAAGAAAAKGSSASSEATPSSPRAAPAAPATTTPRSTTSSGEKGPPTAKCKDGTLSYAQHHSGACSDHGGVAEWLDSTKTQ